MRISQHLSIASLLLTTYCTSALSLTVEEMNKSIENHICPKPVVSVNLIDYREICGEPPLNSMNAQFSYSKCFDRVSHDNLDIVRYNEWLRKSCTRHAQLGEDNRWVVKVVPTPQQAKKINECLDYNRSQAAACDRGKSFAQGPLSTNLVTSFQTMNNLICSNASMQSEVNCVNDDIVENYPIHDRYYVGKMKSASIIQKAKNSVAKFQIAQNSAPPPSKTVVSSTHVIYAYCVPMNRAAYVPDGCDSTADDYLCSPGGVGDGVCVHGSNSIRKFCKASYDNVTWKLRDCDGHSGE